MQYKLGVIRQNRQNTACQTIRSYQIDCDIYVKRVERERKRKQKNKNIKKTMRYELDDSRHNDVEFRRKRNETIH